MMTKEERAVYMKEYRKSDTGRQNIKRCQREYNTTLKGQLAHYKRNIKARYQISFEEYLYLFDKQNGCCAICGINQKDTVRRLSVDHNHETGVVRSLLCGTCNTHLGIFERFKLKAQEYLKGHQAI
jgi:hypothetical protein